MQRQPRWRADAAMTLVEIMIVVAIIGIVVGGVAMSAFASYRRAQVMNARKEVKAIKGAIEVYMTQHADQPPPSLQVLVDGRFLSKAKDPWGALYQFRCPGEHDAHSCDVWALGREAAARTEAVNSWSD